MEGNGYLVSWCVGHLVKLSQPEAYDEKYAKWRYDDLTILPEHWQYQVSASTKKACLGVIAKTDFFYRLRRHREFALCRCMLYTLYKPLTCYLLFCPVGVNGRRYTLPERS